MAMLPVEAALARILDGASPLDAETVPISAASGRVLAEPLVARLTQPPFDASAMDGYAVRRADVAALPVALRVVGESAAGRGYRGAVGASEAVRIFTGAPVPTGADAIVIQENVRPGQDWRELARRELDTRTVTVHDGRPDAAHIRPRGGDFRAGETVLPAGRRLDARALTLAAAAGHGTLRVRRRPVVAILGTGDELVPPGTTPGPDQIVASNAVGLAAMVEAAGGVPRLLGIALDTETSLSDKFREADGADVLVTTGGASEGDHDLVVPALKAHGMTLGFWKIAMRPGKPMIFGHKGPLRLLGLPGNPVSSLICGRVFLMPLVARLAGRAADTIAARTAVLSGPLEQNGPRQHYMRASAVAGPDGALVVTPMTNQDSSLLTPLAAANALIVRPPGAPALQAGASVTTLDLDF